ncbi:MULTISPECIES: hypothetical protein [unclassified Bradyrhizobium]|uniref:hypothetical protein n=1 Tax=unclassified Bradyrhizobium TaxID=2631580 RepID=UPI0010443AC0|nr:MULTISPECIES: hypothetical protein [unclassified Bradyrhizobium]
MRGYYRKLFQALRRTIPRDEPAWGDDAAIAEIRAAFLRAYRRGLEHGAATGPHAVRATVARHRFARNKTQQMAKRLRQGKRVPLPKHLLLTKMHPSPLLDALLADRHSRWQPVIKRDRQQLAELVLAEFSIIDRPVETLQLLRQIALIECSALAAQLHFDDQRCIDIAPYLVLAETWPEMANVFRGGRMTIAIQKVIEAVGLRKALGIRLSHAEDLTDVWAFPIRRRRPARTSRAADRNLAPQAREKVSDEFCDLLDVWMGHAARMELTDEGRARFSSIIGELLDNAERHSDPKTKDGSWSVAAFMARRPEQNRDVFDCHMGFLSEGASIAESLETAAEMVRRDIDDYSARHENKRQSKATLATLVALQDGITRDAAATADRRGGVGFQDVMEFVTAMGGTSLPGREPRITIVSGSSCIQLRPPYILGRRSGPAQPRVMWCNPTNSPNEPPDPEIVFDLQDRFAGTIVGLSFVLDPEYLKAVFDVPNQPR